jgi:hypothetical protein
MKGSIILGSLIIGAAILLGSFLQSGGPVAQYTIKGQYLLDKDSGHVWYMTTKKNLERDMDEAELVLIKVDSLHFDPATKSLAKREAVSLD